MDVFSFEFVLLLRGHKAIGVLPSQNRKLYNKGNLPSSFTSFVNEKTKCH